MQQNKPTILVAGAGSGIGGAVCRKAYQQNMRVIAVSRNAGHLEELSSIAHTIKADLTQHADIQNVLNVLQQDLMPDIVVLNMSTSNERAKLARRSNALTGNEIAAPLQYAFDWLPAIVQHQRRHKFGRWIGIGSMSSKLSVPGMAAYNLQKAAMTQLIFTLAAEEGRNGITGNMVIPGMIDTPLVRNNYTEEELALRSKQNVMHRMGTVDEVAATVMFLASKDAAYITGTELPVNGGNHLGWQYV